MDEPLEIEQRLAPPTPPTVFAAQQLFAIALAVLGGVFGILGAFIQEARAGGFVLIIFLGAPIIEEALKPSGVYLLLLRWPRVLLGRFHTGFLAMLGGLSFGAIESLVYVTIYVDDPPDWFVLYRFTVTLALHGVASFIVGLGLDRGVLDWAAGRAPLPKFTRNAYIAAIGLHAVYNTTAFALGIAGFFDVE